MEDICNSVNDFFKKLNLKRKKNRKLTFCQLNCFGGK